MEVWSTVKWWLLVGLLAAAAIDVLLPAGVLAEWGRGPLAMIAMVLIGVPMYVCASGSTPLAASLIVAGVSPGTALVFLLCGPATNIGTVGAVRRELGTRATMAYLAGVTVTPIALGLSLDALVAATGVDVVSQISLGDRALPAWLGWSAAAVLVGASTIPLWSGKRRALGSRDGVGSTADASGTVPVN